MGQAEQVRLGRIMLLSGQLQVPRFELKVIPVAMQLQAVKEATVVAYGMEEQFRHRVSKLVPTMTIVGERQPQVLVAVTQCSFPMQTHYLWLAEGPIIYVEGVQERHLALAVPAAKMMPLEVVPQSQRVF